MVSSPFHRNKSCCCNLIDLKISNKPKYDLGKEQYTMVWISLIGYNENTVAIRYNLIRFETMLHAEMLMSLRLLDCSCKKKKKKKKL